MKRFLVFVLISVGLRAAPNDILVTQRNSTDTASITTRVAGSVNFILGTDANGKVVAISSLPPLSGPLYINLTGGTMPAAPAGTLIQLGSAPATAGRIIFDSFSANNVIDFRRADGTVSLPSAVQSGDVIGQLGWRGYGTTGYSSSSRATIAGSAAQNWTDAAQGTSIAFNTTPNGSTTPATVLTLGQDKSATFTGMGAFNGAGLTATAGLIAKGPVATNIGLEALENAGVHAIYLRPNVSGTNLISSNFLSGSTYLPLALSAHENLTDFVIGTTGNISIANALSVGKSLSVGGAAFGASGTAVLAFGASTAPSTSPSGVGQLYEDTADNKLKYRGASGTVTTIANP